MQRGAKNVVSALNFVQKMFWLWELKALLWPMKKPVFNASCAKSAARILPLLSVTNNESTPKKMIVVQVIK